MIAGNGNGRLSEAEYAGLVGRVQATVAETVPPGASVLVVSKGDAALLEMPGHIAAHFPQDAGGGYAGHHPHDSDAAMAELEQLRRRGAEYLVIPATARWWLDFYEGLARHLANHGELVADVDGACLVYGLGRSQRNGAAGPAASARPCAAVDQIRDYLERLLGGKTGIVVFGAEEATVAALAPLRATGLCAADGERLLAELKRQADAGAGYLVVPRSADVWLENHAEHAEEIESSCRRVADQRHLCRVFELAGLKGDG